MRAIFILLCWLSGALPILAQTKRPVTIDDIWKTNQFRVETLQGVNWTKDGRYYTSQNDRYIIKYDLNTGREVDTLYGKGLSNAEYIAFDEYTFSPQENKILLANEVEGIYRRSSKAYYYVYDLSTGQLKALDAGGKQSYATFSPDGSKVAFVRQNNLYLTDLKTGQTQALTQDGKPNERIHGSADWVYEEEFSFAQAFFWSPDSKKIAYYTFDESQVKEFVMQYWDGPQAAYPTEYRFKYPKAGEENSRIAISVYHLDKNQTVKMDIGAEADIYIPRIQWTQNPELLSIRRMNRLQNKLEILHAQAQTGQSQVILTETDAAYVDLDYTDDLSYLQDGKHFLHSSERSGYKHLYLFDMKGQLLTTLTAGNWEVAQVHGIDEKNQFVYFSSTEVSPLERHLYRVSLKGKDKTRLSTSAGTHRPNFSPDFRYYLDYFSHTTLPNRVSLHEARSGKEIKVLVDNQALLSKMNGFQIQAPEFFTFSTEDGTSLNGWMIKPADFDPTKRYPVLMYVYGGPGSQTVTNAWGGSRFLWHQVMAAKGYLIVSVDNRGTGARGSAFKKITYAQLGKYETQDQISAARYLATLPYVDARRIGIWGWSYGGYMSSLGISLGAEVFKTAVAVAPVTTWRFYDSIYTERYLKRPQDNPEGYDQYSPITHAGKVKGNYLLIHGTADDNVHFQNAVEWQNALIKAGVQFESFYYPNRNHGIYGGNTSWYLFTQITRFLEKNL
ncbi:MAG: S9 family peptidase [Microscillaceae bacterium]